MIKLILKLNLLLSTLLLSGVLNAQTKKVASLRANHVRMFNINGDSAIIFTSKDQYDYFQLKIWKLNLKSEKLIMLDSTSTYDIKGAEITSKGIFLVIFKSDTSVSGEYDLKFISLNGDTISLGKIGDYKSKENKSFIPIFKNPGNGNCLIHTFINNKFCIWETDGTMVGTKIIFSSNTNIQLLDTFQKGAIVINYENNAYKLYSYAGQGFQNFISLPAITDKPEATKVFSNARFYFSILTDSSNKLNPASTWTTDGTILGTKKIYSKSLSNVISISETKVVYNTRNGLSTLRLDFTDSTYNNPLKFPLSKGACWTGNYFGGRFISVNTTVNGREVGYFDEDDSIRMIKDLAKGSSNGIYLSEENRQKITLFRDEEIYIPATNSLNFKNWHLYKYSPDSTVSLFRLTEGINSNIFFYDSTFYWFCNNFPSFTLYKRHISDKDKPQIAQNENSKDGVTWCRQLGSFQQQYWQYIGSSSLHSREVSFDKEGNIIAGFLENQYSGINVLISSDSNKTYKLQGANIFVKYDRLGRVLWLTSIGTLYGINGLENKFRVDRNGDIIIMANYWQKAFFKNDSLETKRAGTYLAKIDGKTGEIIWKKTIMSAYYTGDVRVDGITFDSYNNIYLAFMYKYFTISIDGQTLDSEISPVNAIAKFDSSGNLILAKNIETPWRNSYGETRVFEYDKKSNILAAVQSQGYYDWLSSCKYMNWNYYTQIMDLDGSIILTSNFIGDDIGGIGTGIFNNSSKLLCSGYFRGKLEIENRHFETTEDKNGCNENEYFKYLYNYKDPKPVLYTTATVNDVFYPLDMAKAGDYIYELGKNAINRLIIHKLDQAGNLVAIKILNQADDDDYYTRFDVSDSFIVIIGHFYNDTLNNIQNHIVNTDNWGSILKIRNNDWIPVTNPALLEKNKPVIIFPNPCKDDLYLHFPSEKIGFDKLEIFNINGQKFGEFDVNTELYQHFNLDNLSSGFYFLRLFGEGKTYSAKFIKN